MSRGRVAVFNTDWSSAWRRLSCSSGWFGLKAIGMKQILALMLMALPVATWAKTQGNGTFFESAVTGGMVEVEFGAMMVKNNGDANAD